MPLRSALLALKALGAAKCPAQTEERQASRGAAARWGPFSPAGAPKDGCPRGLLHIVADAARVNASVSTIGSGADLGRPGAAPAGCEGGVCEGRRPPAATSQTRTCCAVCACYCHCDDGGEDPAADGRGGGGGDGEPVEEDGGGGGGGGGGGVVRVCSGGGGADCRGSPYDCPAVVEALRRSPHFPVLLLPGGSYPQHRAARYGPPSPGTGPGLPLNDPHRPIHVCTDLFSGVMYLFLPGLPTTPPGLFEGRKRRFVLVLQGRFKRPVPADRLLIGCHYRRPLRLGTGGGGFALSTVLSWVSRLMARSGGGGGGGLELVLTGSDPRVRAPVAATANVIHVARPGEQPHPLEARENTRLMGPPLADSVAGRPWSSSQRRQYFRRTDHRRAHVFDTAHVWTFHNWDQGLGYGDCRLHSGLGASVDLVPYLGGLPLEILLEDCRTGQVAAHVQVCHWRQAVAAAAAAGTGATTEAAAAAAAAAAEGASAAAPAGMRTGEVGA